MVVLAVVVVGWGRDVGLYTPTQDSLGVGVWP